MSIVENNQPLVFRDNSNDNFIVNAEKQFYKSIKILIENGHNIDLNVTMYEYRLAIEYNEEKIKLMRSKQAQNN